MVFLILDSFCLYTEGTMKFLKFTHKDIIRIKKSKPYSKPFNLLNLTKDAYHFNNVNIMYYV